MKLRGWTFERLEGGWLHIAGPACSPQNPDVITLSPKEWAALAAIMPEIPPRAPLAPA